MKKSIGRVLASLCLVALLSGGFTLGASAKTADREIDFRLPKLFLQSGAEKGSQKPETRPHLIAAGTTFGVRLASDGVLVVGMSEDEAERVAHRAGIRAGDVILEMNETPIKGAEELTLALKNNGEKRLVLKIRRGSETLHFTLTPYVTENGTPRLGILIRDSAAGIGTVTFIDPETGAFGGLGHGICDGESGALIPTRRGTVLRVMLDGIERGKSGKPGELRGSLCPDKLGVVTANTDCGVFGYLLDRGNAADAIPIASSSELRRGAATLRTSLTDGTPTDYRIEITEIRPDAKGAKCFSLRVTDPALLSATGGIVQGMSGSPIIQDGKLVGAVTHVMVNDPTAGYGIFIENMLNASQMTRNELPAA
jgi:stage IV sporulation protein B